MVDPRTGVALASAELEQIAALRAGGGTIREIAQATGLGTSTISRRLSSPEAREIIERESTRLLAALPDITASSIQQVRTSRQIHDALAGAMGADGQPVKLPEQLSSTAAAIAYAGMAGKRESDILKALGILASPVQSVVIQQIYHDHRQAVLAPDVLRALSALPPDGEDTEEAEIIGGNDAQGEPHRITSSAGDCPDMD